MQVRKNACFQRIALSPQSGLSRALGPSWTQLEAKMEPIGQVVLTLGPNLSKWAGPGSHVMHMEVQVMFNMEQLGTLLRHIRANLGPTERRQKKMGT